MLRRSTALLAALLLAACGGLPTLEQRGSEPPDGVDLSGRWRLSAASEASLKQLADAELAEAGGPRRLVDEIDKPPARASRDALVYMFLKKGRALRITQNPYALFVSFDRAIVEEYRFGEHQPISVGEVRAMRASGWEQGSYIIETVDQTGNRLLDRYRLSEDGEVLIRSIRIARRDRVRLDVEQRFRRE